MKPGRRRRLYGPNVLGVLVALAALGGIGYLLYEELRREPPGAGIAGALSGGESRAGAAEPPQSAAATAAPKPPAAASPEPARSETILTCTAADGQVFYTNATRCDEADLDNRVNVLTPPPLPASRPTHCLGAQSAGPEVHGFLAVCREPFMEALKLEPLLLDMPDPAGSVTARRYCAFITEGVQAGCMATSDQFCFLHVCQVLRESASP